MKSKLIFCLLLIIVTFSLHAQHALYLPDTEEQNPEAWLRLDAALDTGLLFGMLYEYVIIAYDGDGKYNDTLSRLDWELSPLWYAGVTVQAEFWRQLVVDLGFWAGIPLPLGSMEDRDWGTLALGYTGNLEIISFHDNLLINAFFLDINAGYNLVNIPGFVLTPCLGFNWKHILMSGRDGHQEMPPGNTVATFDEELITYEQNYYIFYVGLQTSWSPHPLFTLQLFGCYSPLVFALNIDRHLHPSVAAEYVDLPVFGHYVFVNPAVCVHILKELSLKLQGSFTFIPEFQGKIYTRPLSGGDYVLIGDSRGGASLNAWGISISCQLHLADF